MKKLVFLFTLSLLLVSMAWGQVNISAGATVTQDFSIGTSATATLPSGWRADKNTTVRYVGSYGSAVTATERSGGNSMPTDAANGIYNFGAGPGASATDRAVGGLSSKSASKSVNLYVQLYNNGSSDITNFTISYNVEKYRNGSNSAGFSIQMYYSTNGSNWTSAGSDFLTSFSADANNNGYAPAPGATVSVSNKTLSQALAASSSLYLAWNYSVTSGTTTSNAQALGVDDISITANGGAPSPLISVNGTLSSFSTTTGTASASQSYSVSGSNLTANISITAPSGFEVSTSENSGYQQSISLTQSGGSVASTTVYARLTGALAGNFSGNIAHESTDATTVNLSASGTVTDPTPIVTVNPSTLSGFTYVVDEGPSTHQTFTVSGSTLTADITVTASTNYEISEDGTTYTSPITLTETGGSVAETIIYVRLKAGRAVGAYNNEDITITSTGADDKTVTCSGSVTTPPPSLTEIIVPQFMQGFNGTNNKRLPNAFRFKIDNLIPSATYRYYGMFVLSTDGASVDGAGIGWFVNADNTISRSTTLDFTTAGRFSEFTADATGSYTGWFMGEGSGNAKFTPGNDVYFRIMLNNGADGSSVANRLTTSSSIRVINFGTEANVDQGTFLRGISQAPAKNFLFVYDNEAGTGRPISGTIIENDDLDLSGVNQILALYKNHVDGVNGAWGVIIPNSVGSKSFTGIKRIESRNLIDGSLYAEATDSDGVWPSGVDTRNPTGGDTDMGHLVMGESDATLPVELSTFTVALNNYNNAVLTWVTQTETGVSGFYVFRNTEESLATAEMVSNLIPATNTSQQQVYQFTDKELNQTGTYYYWLMVADMDGSEGFHGPISLNYEQGGLQLPEIPKFTELKNVYPNPFNPSTTISYALANSQNVNFNIFNNRGQMVRSMELGNKAAGNHSFVWDGCDNYGRSVSTGVYFIRMQAGSESFSKKAVLMK